MCTLHQPILVYMKKRLQVDNHRGLFHGGGGTGGSIRDAGGAFGKLEARNEEEYFYKLQQQQLHELKKHLEEEHEREKKEIKRLEESLKKRKKILADLEKKH
ncbi:unnamed protein product [Schistosoma guineensis]|nr:unnamed protein product [Schistosoma guineensis]